MPTHIALLRGINVGGRNRVAMADLRKVVLGLGYTDVATYIQSGNVVFTGEEADTAMIAAAPGPQPPHPRGGRPRLWPPPPRVRRRWGENTPPLGAPTPGGPPRFSG